MLAVHFNKPDLCIAHVHTCSGSCSDLPSDINIIIIPYVAENRRHGPIGGRTHGPNPRTAAAQSRCVYMRESECSIAYCRWLELLRKDDNLNMQIRSN